CMQATEFPLTF
nr:immunoglobulin light chain junction region [Macaca mulatta]MOV62053.1 immunoglobulin light chain junction region [Macaca mulatta]MOV62409.1 immunoglobulin light chain junction region [Macaca mulatta]MOV64510.1 immunoglobulin light chain junction region [Macaca mulatta]